MKKALLISFDLTRPDECPKSLAVASILAALRHRTGAEGEADHLSVNMLHYGSHAGPEDFERWISAYRLNDYSYIALSAYIWNEYLINPFIRHLRRCGYRNAIALGGYQVVYTRRDELQTKYPDCQYFISGYAEESFRRMFTTDSTSVPVFLETTTDFASLPSAYLTGELDVPEGAAMVRFETRRGCPYRCSFCAHRDLVKSSVYKHPFEKVLAEIDFFNQRKVKRVNVLDPVFNLGSDYLQVMEEIVRTHSSATYTLQSRFETIKGDQGQRFLDLCSQASFHLEFGLQTAIHEESALIDRRNNLHLIQQAMQTLKEHGTSYEISLIYGLPGQTPESFRASIDYVLEKGCTCVKAYPLMLLEGTKLFEQKKELKMKEEVMGDFAIPLVTSSYSFTQDDWYRMKEMAEGLAANYRF